MTNIILFITIFWTLLWTWVNFGRLIAKNSLPAINNIFMCIGWTIIIAHIINIW